jgi:hypothetical protein
MIRAQVPPAVHTVVDADGRLVLLNVATGRWHALNRTGAEFYEQLRQLADISLAADAVTDRYHTVPPERIHRDIEQLVGALVRRGLIEIVDDHGRDVAGVPMALADDGEPAPLRYRLAAKAAFPLAVVLLRLPFRLTARLVERLNRARPEASRPVALVILTAARQAGRRYPGRMACLELSLTATLTAAFVGRRVNWCLGFAVDPYTFHAWIELAGEPVVHPSDEPVAPTYRRVFSA